jgi:hypothetical protein
MAKIDIITLTGFTAIDGSLVASGATVKFETSFHAGTTQIGIGLKIYRNRELFEAGYRNIEVIELPNNFMLVVPEEEFYVITPMIIYEKVRDYLNGLFNDDAFEINIIVD